MNPEMIPRQGRELNSIDQIAKSNIGGGQLLQSQ